MPYDEEIERTRHIWGHCTHLMTDFERRVGQAAAAREKAAAAKNPTLARRLSERWGLSEDREVNLALSAGPDAFRLTVCRRLLSEWGEAILNRCPECRRIVRTPKARQCF